MAELKGSKTHQNLLQVFGSEALAVQRSLYFAQVAEIEGYPHVADLHREVAAQEGLTAHGHLDFIRQVSDPVTGLPLGGAERNLQAALVGVGIDEREFYAFMALTAHAEGFPDIASWFETLAKIKRRHAERFQEVFESKGKTEG